jgi:uncharacterized protein (TIGR00299 family) protein
MEEVTFHEVGAVDSIIDIVGAVYGLHTLGVESLYASSLPVGSGFIETAHGRLPVPAPATAALLKGIPVHDSGLSVELVTPTGASLIKGIAASCGSMPPMVVESIGYGVGTRDLPDRPNLLRIFIGKEERTPNTETVVILETHVDDAPPEWTGYLMDRLFKAGALDVVFFPVQMKKNRPGTLVQVMGIPHQKDELAGILFRESTALGVRFQTVQREVLEREVIEKESPWGPLAVKKVVHPDGTVRMVPEYEACRVIAETHHIPLREIYDWIAVLNVKA